MSEVESEVALIASELALLPDWEERIGYILDMARELAPMRPEEKNERTRVRGCVSQVWLLSVRSPEAPDRLVFRGDSDAHLVRGEIALLLRIFSNRAADDILSVDPREVFEMLGLKNALSMQRSNGLYAMMDRIQQEAKAALARS